MFALVCFMRILCHLVSIDHSVLGPVTAKLWRWDNGKGIRPVVEVARDGRDGRKGDYLQIKGE